MVIEAKNDTKLESFTPKETPDKETDGPFADLLGSNAEYWQARKNSQASTLPGDHLILAYADDAIPAVETPLVLLQKELAELESKQDGINSNAYGDCLFKIGAEHMAQGNKIAAEESLSRAVGYWDRFPGLLSSEYGDRLAELAQLYAKYDEPSKAELWLGRSLYVQEQELGKYHPKATDALERLGTHLKACDLLTEAQKRRELAHIPNDDIQKILRSIIQLPTNIEAGIHEDGISLRTNNLPRLVEESTGVNLKTLLTDTLRKDSNIPECARPQLAEDIYKVLRGIAHLENHGNQIKLTSRMETRIPLSDQLTAGYIDGISFAKEIAFKLESPTPETIVIGDLQGVAFTRDNTKVNLTSITFSLQNEQLAVKTQFKLAENKETPVRGSVLDFHSLTSMGSEYFLTKIINNLPEIKIDVDAAAYKAGLGEFHKFKALLSNPQEAKHLIENSTGVPLNDPFFKSIIEGGTRITKNKDTITLERRQQTTCDLGGVQLRVDPKVVIEMIEDPHDLRISRINGMNLDVPFSAPEELKTIGVDLNRSVPKKISHLLITAPDQAGNRFLNVGTGPQTHLHLSLNSDFQPARNAAGHWTLGGTVGSPIDGQPVPFWLRLNGQNQPEMSFDELAAQGIRIATKAVRLDSPSTWKWGAAAVGGQVIRTGVDVWNWAND